MKRVPVYLLVVVLSAGLAAFSQVQRQRPVQPTPAVKAKGKVDQFLKVIQEAKTLDELRTAFERADLTPKELDELKKRVESSSSIKQKMEQLARQAEAEARPTADAEREAKARLAAIRREVTEKQAADIKARAARTRQELAGMLKSRTDLASRLTADPNVVCAADSPTIEKIYGPITPGAEFAILGKGLGPAPGSVDLMVDGRMFRATVNEWNACHVYAQLAHDVQGVRGGQATVVLKTNAGKESSGTIGFEPTLEIRRDTSPQQVVRGWYWGGHGDWEFFDYSLANGWYVVGVSVFHYAHPRDYGHAETTFEPARLMPNVQAKTGLHAGVTAGATVECYVEIYFAGPKGVPHRW